jgi:DNA polymerase-3 subunit epsilon
LALRLNGACLAGHNLPFDLRMLSAEYERLGTNLAMVAGLDTLSAVRCRLGEACDQYGITHLGEHSGAGDALATAELLTRVVDRCEPGAPAVAPTGLKRSGRTLRRGDTTAEPTSDPPFIIRLIAAASDPAEELNKLQYRSLLEIALADLHLDRSERFQLQSLAAELGFSMAEAALEHRRFVDELVAEAISDHEVTEEEHDALVRVASALGVDQQNVERAIDHYLRTDETFTLASGMTVVLTGDHPTLSKQELASRVSVLGLFEGKGVTKKTDLLAAVDPLSPSGKAKKARQYEIPIVAVDDLLAAAPGGSVPVVTTTSSSLKVVTCSQCDKTWTASARSAGRAETVCDECR